MSRWPTIRESDAFLGSLGIEPFDATKVEMVTVRTAEEGDPFGLFYHIERNGESSIAIYWPDTPHQEIT